SCNKFPRPLAADTPGRPEKRAVTDRPYNLQFRISGFEIARIVRFRECLPVWTFIHLEYARSLRRRAAAWRSSLLLIREGRLFCFTRSQQLGGADHPI